MTRDQYLEALLSLYLQQPDTPTRASRNDWAIAADFYRRGIALDSLAHAIRLSTLRRCLRSPEEPALQPIRSLAYYRQVLQGLTPDELDPGYVDYLAGKHAQLLSQLKTSASPRAPGEGDSYGKSAASQPDPRAL
jgi:hypothetical protein